MGGEQFGLLGFDISSGTFDLLGMVAVGIGLLLGFGLYLWSLRATDRVRRPRRFRLAAASCMLASCLVVMPFLSDQGRKQRDHEGADYVRQTYGLDVIHFSMSDGCVRYRAKDGSIGSRTIVSAEKTRDRPWTYTLNNRPCD